MHPLTDKLVAGCQSLGITVPSAPILQLLLKYLSLLEKWNQTYNLVGPASLEVMLARHLLDSLAFLHPSSTEPLVASGQRLLDVGSGAGLPGIPLAICLPQCQVVLCEPRQKRVLFLQQAVQECQLSNVQIEQCRIEDYQPAPHQRFDRITSRAFTDLASFLQASAHCLADEGCWVAMKGAKANEEWQLAALAGYQLVDRVDYSINGEANQHCLLVIKPGS